MKKESIWWEGYFTVEAAFILPLIFGCILLVVYLAIYQYDRCAIEQELNYSTLLSVTESGKSNEERVQIAKNFLGEIKSFCLAWETGSVAHSIQKGKMNNSLSGYVTFPFGTLINQWVNDLWKLHTSSEGTILHPVSFVRNYRKIVGGKSNGNGVH